MSRRFDGNGGSRSGPGSIGEHILTKSQDSRAVVQEFVPLAESLEWELGQQYFRERGAKAFTSDSAPIPFVINNDGNLSCNAAEVLFASLVDADKDGLLEPEIFVLEIGIGVGLFARFFLDRFRELCLNHRQDFYDRLCYVAADKSERMLRDLLRHGVLNEHVGHYCTCVLDAMNPGVLDNRGVKNETESCEQNHGGLSEELRFRGLKGKPFRGVFLNYLLDCLPAAVLKMEAEGEDVVVKQLCVRTCVARNIKLSDYTDLTVSQLQERARVMDASARQDLLEVYGVLASEYGYVPVAIADVPYGAFAFEYRKRTKKMLVNYGAIQCLEGLLPMLAERGFILMNEYGATQLDDEAEFEHQRFSFATAVGLNFPFLKAYFESPGAQTGRQNHGAQNHNSLGVTEIQNHDSMGVGQVGNLPHNNAVSVGQVGNLPYEGRRCQWFEPAGDSRGIHTRLMGNNVSSDTVTRFHERFSDAADQKLQEPIVKARTCLKSGRFELGADFYQQALRLQPRNWVLLNEISAFLTYQMGDPKSAIDMSKVALALNPTCSAELWNTLGDALFEFGRTAEAQAAYEHAMTVNTSDVRSRFNLAFVHTRARDYPAALRVIAEALSLDKTGQFRDQLLQKQNEVLARLAQRNQQEYLLLTNLVSKYAKPGEEEGNHRGTEAQRRQERE